MKNRNVGIVIIGIAFYGKQIGCVHEQLLEPHAQQMETATETMTATEIPEDASWLSKDSEHSD